MDKNTEFLWQLGCSTFIWTVSIWIVLILDVYTPLTLLNFWKKIIQTLILLLRKYD